MEDLPEKQIPLFLPSPFETERYPFRLNFDFVKDEQLRNRLINYNLLMEYASPYYYDTDYIWNRDEKNYLFYVSTAALLEEIVNYFFISMYTNIDKIQRVIKKYYQYTNLRHPYKIRKNVKDIKDIAFLPKIDIICFLIMCGYYRVILRSLRQFINQQLDAKKRHKGFDTFNDEFNYISVCDAIIMIVIQIRRNIEARRHSLSNIQ